MKLTPEARDQLSCASSATKPSPNKACTPAAYAGAEPAGRTRFVKRGECEKVCEEEGFEMNFKPEEGPEEG